MRYSWALLMGFAIPVVLAGCGASSSAAPGPTAKAPQVKVATISIAGQKHTVLENSRGDTLYYNTKDTSTQQFCGTVCQALWPTVKAKTAPAHITGAPGKFSVVDGQLEYQGRRLYTYRGDPGAGDSNGQGAQGIWYVATTGLAMAGAASSGTGGSGW